MSNESPERISVTETNLVHLERVAMFAAILLYKEHQSFMETHPGTIVPYYAAQAGFNRAMAELINAITSGRGEVK